MTTVLSRDCCAESDLELAGIFSALASPAQLDMLRQLRCEADVSACGFDAQHNLAQPTVSSHLRVLREAGLVRAERSGSRVAYSIVPGALDVAARQIEALR